MIRLLCGIALFASVGCSEGTTQAESEPGRNETGEQFAATAGGSQTVAAVASAGVSIAPTAADTDWPWWRGPNRNGIAADGQRPPVKWDENTNVVWKAPVPGRGHSSPIVVGDLIVLATADERQQVQSVMAFDRQTGRDLWKTDLLNGGLPRRIHQKNTHATGTVACDGKKLFVAFYNSNQIRAAALDLDGNKLWEQDLGPFQPKQYQYGYAPSPTLYKSLVIFAADYDQGGYLIALQAADGKPAWRRDRPARLSYSSPIVANVAGRDQLLISGCDRVAAYDPANGNELWQTSATTMATCGTMTWEGDLVFASGGYPDAETACIRADGTGKVVWRNRQKCYEQSMLVHDGHVYAVTDGGVAYCWKSDDGAERWSQRLGGPVSASPILAGGNIYLSNERGTTFVFEADPSGFRPVAENRLGTEAFATPAICGGRIFLRVASGQGGRRQETLYCIGEGAGG